MEKSPHIPVLLDAVLEHFSRSSQGFLIDCTLGYAGHSSALLERLPQLSLVGIDRDEEALSFSATKLAPFKGRFSLYRGSFAQLLPQIKERPIVGVLADFGVSSLQLDKAARGFSFESDSLDMRMDQRASLSAYEVVNHYSREELAYILREYGEIREADRLAEAIIQARTHSPIESAKRLSQIARDTLRNRGKIHPATLMFQAIRIEVNNELGEIEGLLDTLERLRPSGAIISLITFHSLEDRLVKNRFKRWSQSCICDPQALRCTCGNQHALGKMLNRKPITAGSGEIRQNPRSRSAKLRSFQFKESE